MMSNVNFIDRNRFLSIGEVSRSTRIKESTLRYWEKEFSLYLKPGKTEGNQRNYTRKNMEVIQEINHLLNVEKYTIAGARQRMAKQRAMQRSFKDVLKSALEEVSSGKSITETVKKYVDYDDIILPMVFGTVLWKGIDFISTYLSPLFLRAKINSLTSPRI